MKNKFLNQTLKGAKFYILLSLILSAISSKLTIYIPMFIKYALDGIVQGNEEVIPKIIRNLFYVDDKISKIIILAIVLIVVNILIVLTNYLKSKVNTKFNLKINKNVKETILEYIPKIEYIEFSNTDKANIIQRVNSDANTYSNFFNSQINLFFDTTFIIIFAIVQTLKLNITIGIFTSTICLIILILSIWYFKVSKPLVEDIVEMNRKVIKKTTESIEESKMHKIFGRREKEIKDFSKVNKEYKAKDIKLAKIKVIYAIGTHTIRNFNQPFVLLWGGILVVQGKLTLATISILLSYSKKILGYVYNAVKELKDVNEFVVAYKKLTELINTKKDIETNPNIKLDGNIIFRNVTIKINENIILQNLNFEINKNENVAIIGDNGYGKTVLAKTLLGFYPYEGEILIGKQNIRNTSKKSIREYIGIVLQDTYLFNNTIKENIKITNPKLNDEEIIKICKLANIDKDIYNLEEKFDFYIEKGGNNISGGQKQRIAIARTLAKQTQFIIFDDSLSKLDNKTKLNILNNMIELQIGTIIISHDVEIAKKCDKVLFINNKTIEVGTHNGLIEINPKYKEIIENNKNKVLEE